MSTIDRVWKQVRPELFDRASAMLLALESEWRDLAGDLADLSWPVNYRAGILTLSVYPPEAQQTLTRATPALLNRLAERFPRILCNEIQLSPGPLRRIARPEPVRSATPEAQPPPGVMAAIERTLAGSPDSPMKAVVREMMIEQWRQEAAEGLPSLLLEDEIDPPSGLPLPKEEPPPGLPAMDPLSGKLDALESILSEIGSVVIGYSGGIDSTLLAVAAHRVLGDRSLAVLGVSPSLPKSEYDEALAVAAKMGFPVRLVETHEMERPGYAANEGDRCYHCRVELYEVLGKVARDSEFRCVADGYNVSDAGDYRPGRKAALEFEVRSPLHEAGLTKEDIRELARQLDIPTWAKPAAACLSSRIPHGTPVTPDRLSQVERAEAVLAKLGFEGARVRHHETIARIEVQTGDIPRLLDAALRERISVEIRAAGYQYVALDLEGYRRGSLN